MTDSRFKISIQQNLLIKFFFDFFFFLLPLSPAMKTEEYLEALRGASQRTTFLSGCLWDVFLEKGKACWRPEDPEEGLLILKAAKEVEERLNKYPNDPQTAFSALSPEVRALLQKLLEEQLATLNELRIGLKVFSFFFLSKKKKPSVHSNSCFWAPQDPDDDDIADDDDYDVDAYFALKDLESSRHTIKQLLSAFSLP